MFNLTLFHNVHSSTHLCCLFVVKTSCGCCSNRTADLSLLCCSSPAFLHSHLHLFLLIVPLVLCGGSVYYFIVFEVYHLILVIYLHTSKAEVVWASHVFSSGFLSPVMFVGKLFE